MKFDLCIGGGDVFWEFRDVRDRDIVFKNLTENHGWEEGWAEIMGDGCGPRCCIVLHPERMPISYRWNISMGEEA